MSDFDADYYALEGAVDLNGLGIKTVTLKVGIESLGSDNGDYGLQHRLPRYINLMVGQIRF
ncbi:hypothetical protein P4S63_26285 [Pseudoalteromonas sp. B193]